MSRAARHAAQLRVMQATSSAWLRGPFARGSQPRLRIKRRILDSQKSSAASQRVLMVQRWDLCARCPADRRRIHAAPEEKVAGREDGSGSGDGGGSSGGGGGEGRDFDPVVFWTIEAERSEAASHSVSFVYAALPGRVIFGHVRVPGAGVFVRLLLLMYHTRPARVDTTITTTITTITKMPSARQGGDDARGRDEEVPPRPVGH